MIQYCNGKSQIDNTRTDTMKRLKVTRKRTIKDKITSVTKNIGLLKISRKWTTEQKGFQ